MTNSVPNDTNINERERRFDMRPPVFLAPDSAICKSRRNVPVRSHSDKNFCVYVTLQLDRWGWSQIRNVKVAFLRSDGSTKFDRLHAALSDRRSDLSSASGQ